jgi:UDP-GlcNAc:undecaprenyl-phosphate GlcNAc-1-phosphate transferase
MGHGHGRAVVILWAWTTVLSGLVLYPTYFQQGNAIIPIGIAALGVLLFTILRPRITVGTDEDLEPRAGPPTSLVGTARPAAPEASSR